MYHPAKVEQVIDADKRPVVMVQTWDRNTFMVKAADGIAAEDIEEGDVVLLDYYSDDGFDIPKPRRVVSHVLDEETGEAVWETYEQQFEGNASQQTAAMQQMPQGAFDGNYIG